MTIEQERLTPTQEDREAAAKALGYKDWGDATDYRLTGEQDRQAAAMVEHFARHRLAALKSPPIAGGEGVFAITDEVVAYIQRYGGRCRDCADYDGACPGSGLPCGESGKAVRWVLKALNYGLSHGFVTLEPAPDLSKPTTSGDVGKLCEALQGVWEFIDHLPMDATQDHLNTIDEAATLLTQMEARTAALEKAISDVLPSAAGAANQPDTKVIAFYINMGELRGLRALLTGAGS
jgi:hypothetical protein